LRVRENNTRKRKRERAGFAGNGKKHCHPGHSEAQSRGLCAAGQTIPGLRRRGSARDDIEIRPRDKPEGDEGC